MDSALFLIYALAYALLLILAAVIWSKDTDRGLCYLLAAVTAALLWDNAVLGAGIWIGKGTLLESLHVSRYWLHAVVTPLLVPVSLDFARRAKVKLAEHPAALSAAWLYTAFLIALEIGTVTWSLRLTPKLMHGALHYINENSPGPPWMIILVMLPVAAAAVILWRKKKTKALLWGILVMIAGGAVRLDALTGALTNAFELVLTASLWMAVWRTADRSGPIHGQ